MKEIVILGGPNGAGKTTAALVLLKEFLELHAFVNADELARSAEVGQLRAGRLMLERMRELISEPKSFAIETTCAGNDGDVYRSRSNAPNIAADVERD